MKPPLLFIIGTIVLAGCVLWWHQQGSDSNRGDTSGLASSTTESVESVTRLYRKPPRDTSPEQQNYRNEYAWFQVILPTTTSITEEMLPRGTRHITFTDGSRKASIYLVPHGDDYITDYRLTTDLPNGRQSDIESTSVDGIEAQSFTSTRDELGETREIWFIHKGFLYEAYAARHDEAWLKSVLALWEFL